MPTLRAGYVRGSHFGKRQTVRLLCFQVCAGDSRKIVPQFENRPSTRGINPMAVKSTDEVMAKLSCLIWYPLGELPGAHADTSSRGVNRMNVNPKPHEQGSWAPTQLSPQQPAQSGHSLQNVRSNSRYSAVLMLILSVMKASSVTRHLPHEPVSERPPVGHRATRRGWVVRPHVRVTSRPILCNTI